MKLYSHYLKALFITSFRKKLVDRVCENIIKSEIEFDSIVVTGVSGILIVPEISAKLNKPFTILRKDGDSSHSTNKLEGWGDFSKYIIIDDFIDTGTTVKRIIQSVDNAKCVGIFLHSSAILGFESYDYAEYPIKLVGSYLDLDDYSKLQESCNYEKSEFNPATEAN